jgi:hypothetical protein
MARSEEALGGRDRSSTLADAFEAVLGAIYLNAGLDAARRFVQEYLFPEVDLTRSWDYKSTLQEQLQERFRSAPIYRIISEAGPAHAKEFIAEVYLGTELLGAGRGGSKKQAEQVAAAEALMHLATRVKKTRRTRKSAPVEQTAPSAERPTPPVEAFETTLPEVVETPAPGSDMAPAAPPAAEAFTPKTFRRPRKRSVPTAPSAGEEAGPPAPDTVPPVKAVADEAASPSIAPAEPARRVRTSRKAAAAAAVPDAGDAPPAPAAAAEAAPKRGRRVAKTARAAEAADAAAAEASDSPPSPTPVTPAGGATARPRVRRRKPGAASPGAETTDEGN